VNLVTTNDARVTITIDPVNWMNKLTGKSRSKNGRTSKLSDF